MFLGHVAVGMAAKRAAPRVSLTVLILAAQLADVIWPVLVGLGVEQVAIEPGNTRVTPLNFISYPYSHSLLTLTLWAIAFAYVFGFSRGRRAIPVLGVLVVSHWLLDVVTHRPDMPVLPQSALKLGFGLWNSSPRRSSSSSRCTARACGFTPSRRAHATASDTGDSRCWRAFWLSSTWPTCSARRRRQSMRSGWPRQQAPP